MFNLFRGRLKELLLMVRPSINIQSNNPNLIKRIFIIGITIPDDKFHILAGSFQKNGFKFPGLVIRLLIGVKLDISDRFKINNLLIRSMPINSIL